MGEKSKIIYEFKKIKKSGETKIYATVAPKRPLGSENLNQYCRALLHLFRCNQDMKIIIDWD